MTLPGLYDTGRATSKSLSDKELTIFRVGIFTTLKMVKQLSHSDLQVAQNVYYDSQRRLHYTLRLHTIKFYSIFVLQRLTKDQTRTIM